MRHFIGGAAVGMIFVILCSSFNDVKYTKLSDAEFLLHMAAWLIISCIFGAAAWGLLP